MVTGEQLVEFARGKIGTPYVYGMKGAVMTLTKYNQLKKQYGSYVWNSDKNKVGKVCCDCSGLISWATGILRGSTNYKDTALEVHPISTIANAPIGVAVWQQGHIGIYAGMKNGVPYYVAEDGSAYGCRENKLSRAKFTHWLVLCDVTYQENAESEEEDEMVKRYETIPELPDWAKPTIQKLVKSGKIADGNRLNMTEDMLRILVIVNR